MININTVEAGRGASWLLEGFDYFKRSPGVWIGCTLLFGLMYFLSMIIPLGGIAFQLLSPVLIAGLLLGCQQIDTGQQLAVKHLFDGFRKNTGQLVLVGVLYLAGLLVLVFLTGFIGFLMLGSVIMNPELYSGDALVLQHATSFALIMLIAMALLVPLVMALWFAPVLVILEDQGAVDAIVLSFRGCLRNIMPFLIYGLVGLVLSILASIPLMLGWLILFPMLVASIYLGYKDIYSSSVVQLADA